MILNVAFHRGSFQAQFCSSYLSMISLTSLYRSLCTKWKMYYYFHMFCRLRKIRLSALLKIYKAHVQSKIYYGLSIWGGTTEVYLNHVQQIQNFLARIICNNFDYIHSRGIDLVRSLKVQTIRERRDHSLCVLMFKCIHGLAPHYLIIEVTMHVDIHGYKERWDWVFFCIRVVHYGISCLLGKKNIRL